MLREVSDLPESVIIGTTVYTIIHDPTLWMAYENASATKGYYGATQFRQSQILLNPEMSAEQTRLTLWHEILHALNQSVMGDPNWTRLSKDPEEAEEIMVRRLEHPTLAVLRDNPDLVLYLLSGVLVSDE